MRVLLINPPYPFEEFPQPPLGLAYLAAALEREGVEVQLLDLLVAQYSPKKVRQKLSEFGPQVVGATASTMNYPAASRILRVCKSFDPNLVTVIGGPHVSFAAQETLEKAPWIDIVVRGEGEETLVELLRSLGGVRGIAFRRDGRMVMTEARPLIRQLDGLPLPARHLVPLSRYRALRAPVSLITSRGCPYECIFCSAPRMFGRKVRYRDPELVVDEIEAINRGLGFNEINIVDDTFTLNHRHVQSICHGIRARGLDIQWTAYSRVDTVSRDLLRMMKEAGCTWICFGIESGCPEVLARTKKKISLEQAKKAMSLAEEAGINALASFILGLPGETQGSAQRTVAFAQELRANYGASYGFHVLAPLPGTEVRAKAREYGIKILTNNWARYNANLPVAEPVGMPAQDIIEIIDRYNTEVAYAWDEMEASVAGGDSVYKARVDKKNTQEFVWRLLKSDIIEKEGKTGGSREELSRRIAQRLGTPLARAEPEVARLVEEGNLIYQPSGEGWRWS